MKTKGRPDYAAHIGEYFNMPIRTKAQIQRIGNERKAPLLTKWQQSQDFAVYEDDDYLWDTLQCYEKVTTPAIQGLVQYLGEAKGTLIDVWNGCSLSSIQAAEAGFDVYVVNSSPKQLQLGQFLQQKMLGYELPVVELRTDLKFDFVCSFEVLEHYKEPLVHLDELIGLLNPNGHLAIGTGFNDANNVGHYETHIVNGIEMKNREVPKHLDKHLISNGFTKVYSHFNGRPRIWTRK
jgi:2-polyprenyl-3-methyl-5-hydroxy-6-metoxy-1,4-benzoquinol methylase